MRKIRKISKEPGSEKMTIKLDEIIGLVNRLVDKVEELDKKVKKMENKFRVYGPKSPPPVNRGWKENFDEAENNTPSPTGWISI